MLPETLTRINWIDIFVVILLFRTGYISLQSGLPIEIFKLFGIISAIYLAMHYYSLLSGFLSGNLLFLQKLPSEFLDFCVFSSLALVGYLAFVFLRAIFYRFIKVDATAPLDRWGGFTLGVIRGFLLSSLILFIFALSPVDYFEDSVNKSCSGKYLLSLSPNVYSGLWKSIFSKFRAGEKFNEHAFEVIENQQKKE